MSQQGGDVDESTDHHDVRPVSILCDLLGDLGRKRSGTGPQAPPPERRCQADDRDLMTAGLRETLGPGSMRATEPRLGQHHPHDQTLRTAARASKPRSMAFTSSGRSNIN